MKSDSIGIYGLSYGGLNTLQALARDSDKFSVGVANAPGEKLYRLEIIF